MVISVQCTRFIDLRILILMSRLLHQYSLFCFYCYVDHRDLHSFPTRRSSDLRSRACRLVPTKRIDPRFAASWRANLDRKSTRLNSSHVEISYAVFCLKKKTNTTTTLGSHPA